jgi:glycosyltransferase involved in cell wall biosynthesis
MKIEAAELPSPAALRKGKAGPPYPIALVIQKLNAGGSERQLTEIAKHLDRDHFQPHVVCLRAGGMRVPELKEAGVPICHIPISSVASVHTLQSLRFFGEYLHANNIQLIHTFDPPSNWIVAPVGRFYRTPVVLTSQRSSRKIRKPFSRFMLRLSDRLSDGVVVNSLAVQRELVSEENVPESRVHLCYNGIDAARFFTPERLRHPDNLLTVGCVCVLRKEKGLDTLIRSIHQVRSVHRQVRLRLIGSGPEKDALQSLAAELGIADACEFKNETDKVAEALRGIEVFVLPSLSEALSNSLMEAMASGCCCLASNVGGNPELIKHKRTGLLFAAGDVDDLSAALRTVLSDAALRNQLGKEASRVVAEDFALTAAAHRMGEIYNLHLRARGVLD